MNNFEIFLQGLRTENNVSGKYFKTFHSNALCLTGNCCRILYEEFLLLNQFLI